MMMISTIIIVMMMISTIIIVMMMISTIIKIIILVRVMAVKNGHKLLHHNLIYTLLLQQ